MRLLAYRRTNDPAVVDAVFTAPKKRFFHLQRVDAFDARDSRVQYDLCIHFPDLGMVADGYDVMVAAGTGPQARLELESRWHEVVARALVAPDGEYGFARFFADAFDQFKLELRSSNSR